MGADAASAVTQRLMSLEDIIRQQEQAITAVLQRLRDVEQYAVAESHSRQELQQKLYAAITERSHATAEAANRVETILQSHNDRLSTLQADIQGQSTALRGTNDKYDAVCRGMEERLNANVTGMTQRVQSSEAAFAESIRSVQAQLQSLTSAAQIVESRSRDDILATRQQMGAEIAAQRQRSENMESVIRDALREVHGSLLGELRSAGAQQRGDFENALQQVNQRLDALDQRTRLDMNQLHSTEQNDIGGLRRSINDLDGKLREVIQGATNSLARELAQIVQHNHGQDKRQETAHQAILQELAKHDSQLETVDLNWRASVTEAFSTMRDSVAAMQHRSAAEDEVLRSQIVALQDRFVAATNTLGSDLKALATSVQDTCVAPIQEAHRTLSAQEQRLVHLSNNFSSLQNYLNVFAARVDGDAAQLKQVVEAAVRAAHADLVERINVSSAALATLQDTGVFRTEVNRGLMRLWEDAKGIFLTQGSLADMQSQLAALESAVRVELCAMAERNKDICRSIDELRTWRHGTAHATSTPVTNTVGTTSSRRMDSRSLSLAADSAGAVAKPITSSVTAAVAGVGLSTSRGMTYTASGVASVEEIDTDIEPEDDRREQHKKGIAEVRTSRPRLHIARVQDIGASSISNPTNVAGVAVGQLDNARVEARSAAQGAAKSAQAAGEAQEESLPTAGELRSALQRIDLLEESLRLHLMRSQPTREASAPIQEPLNSKSLPQLHRNRGPGSSDGATEVTLSTRPTSSLVSFEKPIAGHEDARNPMPNKSVVQPGPRAGASFATSDQTTFALASLPSDGASIHGEKLTRVQRDSEEAKKMVVRENTTSVTSTASQPRLLVSTRGVEKVLSSNSFPDVVVRFTREDMPSAPLSQRGSPLSEVLLPTHQFVRKREYNTFKDFIKREIDSIWVELLNVRRAGGISREDLLLQVGQSKEQVLNTIKAIIKQQEERVLGSLADIKKQLSDFIGRPDLAPEIRVFSVSDKDRLNTVMRHLSEIGNVKESVSDGLSSPFPRIEQGLQRPEVIGPTPQLDTQKPFVSSTAPLDSGLMMPHEEPKHASSKSGREAPDSSFSGTSSVSVLEPQLIRPVVKRWVNPPSLKSTSQDVIYANIDEMEAPQSGDSSQHQQQRKTSVSSHTSSTGPHMVRPYTNPATLHSEAVDSVPQLAESNIVKSQQDPIDVPSSSVQFPHRTPSNSLLPHIRSMNGAQPGVPAAAASGDFGVHGDRGSTRPVRVSTTHSAPLPDLPRCMSDWTICRRQLPESDLNMLLGESDYRCNPVGPSHHLNPLPDIVVRDSMTHGNPVVCSRTVPRSAPPAGAYPRSKRSVGWKAQAGVSHSGKGVPEYSLAGGSTAVRIPREMPESQGWDQINILPKAHHPSNMSQESDIHAESVAKMRPAIGRLRHESDDAIESTAPHPDESKAEVRDPRHLYKREFPSEGRPSLLVLQSPLKESDSDFKTIWHYPPQLYVQPPPPPQQQYSGVSIERRPAEDVIRLGRYPEPPSPGADDRALAMMIINASIRIVSSEFSDGSTSMSRLSSTEEKNVSTSLTASSMVPVRVLDSRVHLLDGVENSDDPSEANFDPSPES